MRDYFNRGKITFLFPLDGDCLNSADGKADGDRLYIRARVRAGDAAALQINGVPAVKNGDTFTAEIVLAWGKNVLLASADGGECAKISVWRLKNAEKGFRLSSDDNILCLKDIAEHADEYRSVFENPYLAVYREAHEKYGAKVHLNLFFETADLDGFTPRPDYFNLTMMPDKFKSEWEENSDWLRLSFHARKENPMSPYKNASAEEITADCLAVDREIARFAGEKTLARETTIHFGAVTKEGVAALRALGYRRLAGYFELYNGDPLVSYFYPTEFIPHVGARDFWRDTELDVTYARIDRVINYSPEPEVNVAELKKIAEDAHRGGFLEFMIHEQYFYKNYCNYIPKFREIVLECCRFAYENGYIGRFLSEAEE